MTSTFKRLISHLHRGGRWGYWWTKGRGGTRWWPAGDPAQIPVTWAGRNVYFGVNPSTAKGKRGTIATTAALNCVFAEFDAKDHEDGKDGALAHILALSAQPSVIVDSGGGYHCYWLLRDTFHIASDEDRKLAKDTQAAWVALVASDGGAKDLARVLRVPGQMNHKYEPARPVEFVRADFDLLYDWQTIVDMTADLRAAATRSKPVQTAQAAHGGPVAVEAARIAEALRYIPTQPGYDVWLRVLMAVHSVYPGADGVALCEAWSPGYDGEVEKKFGSFKANGGVGIGTLFEIAKQHGYQTTTTAAQPAKNVSLLTQHIESLEPLEPGELHFADGLRTHEITGNEFEPNESDLIRAEINELIDWCKSHSFEQFFPLELQLPNGYRTDSTDTRVAVALLNVCHERATFTPIISLRDLARRAGVGSHHTVSKALVRLDGWFCTRRADGVIDVARRLPTDTHSDASTMHMGNLRATYETRLDDDVFLTGYSRTKRAEATAEAQRRGVKAVGQVICHKTGKVIVDDLPVKNGAIVGNPFTGEQMVENGFDLRVLSPWRVVMRDYLAGLGESVLRIVDAIEIHGAMTRAELVEVTGKTKSAISRATLQAVNAGILTADQEHRRAPKIYSLCEDWRETVEDLRPKLKTYMLTTERQARDCQERIEYADRLLSSPKTEEDQRRRLEKRKARAQRRWAELMAILRPDVDPVLWSTAPVQMTRSFMDWSPVLQEHRQERTVRDMQTVSDLMQPDRLLRRRELAKLRTAAGRLNVKISTYDGLAYAAD